MRIEYEGTIEVQPPFQHVGYVSAATTNKLLGLGTQASASLALLLVVSLVVSLIARRRLSPVRVEATVVAVIILGLLAIVLPTFTRASGG